MANWNCLMNEEEIPDVDSDKNNYYYYLLIIDVRVWDVSDESVWCVCVCEWVINCAANKRHHIIYLHINIKYFQNGAIKEPPNNNNNNNNTV